ncbi:MAG TPA: hypothetical protein VMZ26_10055 [Pyrinomonadaceae bacterium]|nr:hypothetical protein [Pyrinomonadaceae bacterium]
MAKKARTLEPAPSAGFNWDLLLKVVGALVGVAGVVFGIYQYNARKDETKEARKYQQYIKATGIAAGFAQATTKQEALEKRRQFWEVYNGELSIVEDERVKKAMMNFGGAIREWDKYNSGDSDFSAPSMFELEEKDGKPQTFDQLAYELSQACRQSLEE